MRQSFCTWYRSGSLPDFGQVEDWRDGKSYLYSKELDTTGKG